MSVARHNTMRWWMLGATAFVVMTAPMQSWGQAADAGQTGAATGEKAQLGAGVVLDRVIAVVNGDVILESDVDEERRFEEIQPFRSVQDSTRAKIIERLVDRELILQQAALLPDDQIQDKALDGQIARMRTDI